MRKTVMLALVDFSFLTAIASQSEQPILNTRTNLAVPELMELAKSNAAVAVNAANVPIHDDQKAVAELDTQYQAAVKKNDAATMDRFWLMISYL